MANFFDIIVQIDYILPQLRSNALRMPYFVLAFAIDLQNICERTRFKRISFGTGGNYFDGKKYCRRCGVYMHYKGLFCPYCGMQLADACMSCLFML
jgi:hypothetical protein